MSTISLRELFRSRPIVRIVGAHNALGAKLIERNGFDGIWASGLEISTAHAVPDANILTMTEYLNAALSMKEATSLPVICDCDTGYGNSSNVAYMVKKYEAAGIAAVVIEDKLFPKVNSFVPGRQDLATIEEFCGKIEAAKSAQRGKDFMVFARVEALIAGWGMEEAMRRAKAYLAAGADGIVIHSKAETPSEIFTFAAEWKGRSPLVAIPTTYSSVTADELARRGFNMVIYANHGLRAAIRAMDETFREIQKSGSTASVESKIVSMKEVFELQGMPDLKKHEERYSPKNPVLAVIPAAAERRRRTGLDAALGGKPLCMVPISGKTLLERQADTLRSAGVSDIRVIGGRDAGLITADGVKIVQKPADAPSGIVSSILAARPHFKEKVLIVYSDVLFDRGIVEQVIKSPHPVTIVVDRAFDSLPFRDKKRDLVITDDGAPNAARRLEPGHYKPVRRIGVSVKSAEATCEFAGIAFFQGEGLNAFTRAWDDIQALPQDKKFYDSEAPAKADLNDVLQFLIDSGFPVQGFEIEHGWSEIHSLEDLERAKAHFEKAPAPVLRVR